jgi:hypothetical protein
VLILPRSVELLVVVSYWLIVGLVIRYLSKPRVAIDHFDGWQCLGACWVELGLPERCRLYRGTVWFESAP